MWREDLREQLAAIEHDRWADWQRWVHGRGQRGAAGDLVIPAKVVAGWERQIATPYAELSDDEQGWDRKEVDRYWPLIERFLVVVEAAKAWRDYHGSEHFVVRDGRWVDVLDDEERALAAAVDALARPVAEPQ